MEKRISSQEEKLSIIKKPDFYGAYFYGVIPPLNSLVSVQLFFFPEDVFMWLFTFHGRRSMPARMISAERFKIK